MNMKRITVIGTLAFLAMAAFAAGTSEEVPDKTYKITTVNWNTPYGLTKVLPSSDDEILELFEDFMDEFDIEEEELDADSYSLPLGTKTVIDAFIAENRSELDAVIEAELEDYIQPYMTEGAFTRIGSYIWMVQLEG